MDSFRFDAIAALVETVGVVFFSFFLIGRFVFDFLFGSIDPLVAPVDVSHWSVGTGWGGAGGGAAGGVCVSRADHVRSLPSFLPSFSTVSFVFFFFYLVVPSFCRRQSQFTGFYLVLLGFT